MKKLKNINNYLEYNTYFKKKYIVKMIYYYFQILVK